MTRMQTPAGGSSPPEPSGSRARDVVGWLLDPHEYLDGVETRHLLAEAAMLSTLAYVAILLVEVIPAEGMALSFVGICLVFLTAALSLGAFWRTVEALERLSTLLHTRHYPQRGRDVSVLDDVVALRKRTILSLVGVAWFLSRSILFAGMVYAEGGIPDDALTPAALRLWGFFALVTYSPVIPPIGGGGWQTTVVSFGLLPAFEVSAYGFGVACAVGLLVTWRADALDAVDDSTVDRGESS